MINITWVQYMRQLPPYEAAIIQRHDLREELVHFVDHVQNSKKDGDLVERLDNALQNAYLDARPDLAILAGLRTGNVTPAQAQLGMMAYLRFEERENGQHLVDNEALTMYVLGAIDYFSR